MIRFLLQVLPERLLERLGSAEEERLHRPLRAAERRGHVAVGEAVDTREEKGCALLRRQLADRRLELTRQLAGRCALPGRGRRGGGEPRAPGERRVRPPPARRVLAAAARRRRV